MSAAIVSVLRAVLEEPCADSLEWARALPESTTPRAAWETYQDPAGLAWFVAVLDTQRGVELSRAAIKLAQAAFRARREEHSNAREEWRALIGAYNDQRAYEQARVHLEHAENAMIDTETALGIARRLDIEDAHAIMSAVAAATSRGEALALIHREVSWEWVDARLPKPKTRGEDG